MKISREWLQTFFDQELPSADALADALTFHAFEIESVEGDILDVKVTPNRGHDCLSHRGIAKEVSAILKLPLAPFPYDTEAITLEPKTDVVKVTIEDPKLCPRFTGAYIKGVHVGPSPDWLQKRLEAVGQKSINNVVDATNFVMFDMGQPLHAFDAGKLNEKKGHRALTIRLAKKGETLLGLDDKEYALLPSMLVIEDTNADLIASIAGIKGGKPTGIDETTKDIFLEAANWDGVTIRKASQALKLRTDASDRFQQVISPELAACGTLAAAKLIIELGGGEITGYIDEYPFRTRRVLNQVAVSTKKINDVLGTDLTKDDIADAFRRLGLSFTLKEDEFIVDAPFERLDLKISEDLIEEVGRIVGYDKIAAVELPKFSKTPDVNANFYSAEKVREELMTKGYSEVYTSVFADKGKREVLNKVGGERPYLRSTLVDGLREAYERNLRNKDLLGLSEVKLFEIGVVWGKGDERMMVGTADVGGINEGPLKSAASSTYDPLPTSSTERYQPFSKYPFIVRDIALWVQSGTVADAVLTIIRKNAGMLLVRSEKFDEFKKGDKQSYAFRLIFQSFDRTLTDFDANERMESIYAAVKKEGWEVR